MGEHFRLDVIPAGGEALETAADTKVAEVVSPKELIGRAAGTTTVTLKQGGAEKTVRVRVEETPIEALRVEPANVSLSPGSTARLRLGRERWPRDRD